MTYKVESVVCDYGIYRYHEGEKTLIEIVDNYQNALLIADVLNADASKEVYDCAKTHLTEDRSRVNQALKALQVWKESVGFNEVECERSEVREAISNSFVCLKCLTDDLAYIRSLALRVKNHRGNIDVLIDFIDYLAEGNSEVR